MIIIKFHSAEALAVTSGPQLKTHVVEPGEPRLEKQQEEVSTTCLVLMRRGSKQHYANVPP